MNVAGTITVDIRDMITADQNVLDSTGAKVGDVGDVDLATGWFTVFSGPLADQAFYVPFKLITNIDPHELFLSVSRDDLVRDYATPPARTTAVQGEAATTTQQSGYGDGAPVVVSQTRLDAFRNKISTDFEVFTSDLTDLGRVREYDAATGLMVLAKGPFSKHDVLVPISAVYDVDAELGNVTLIASKADVERMKPVDLVRTAAQMAERS